MFTEKDLKIARAIWQLHQTCGDLKIVECLLGSKAFHNCISKDCYIALDRWIQSNYANAEGADMDYQPPKVHEKYDISDVSFSERAEKFNELFRAIL